MKKINLLFICLMVLSVNAFEQTKPKGQIHISDGTLKIDNYVFNRPWTLKAFTSALGEVERIAPDATSIHTYDSRGIILYTNESLATATDFNVYFRKDPNENYTWVPKQLAKLAVQVENFKITGKTTLKKLQTGLPKYNFKKSIIGAYEGEYNHLYIYVQFDASEKNVYWISVGKHD